MLPVALGVQMAGHRRNGRTAFTGIYADRSGNVTVYDKILFYQLVQKVSSYRVISRLI